MPSAFPSPIELLRDPVSLTVFALYGGLITWEALAPALVVGLTPEATTLVLLATTFLSAFQHANLRTPRWLGYLIQRPESHSRHHERGVHAGNYADLPVFDLLFGTFHNPARFAAQAGFENGASSRVTDMLLACDVSGARARA